MKSGKTFCQAILFLVFFTATAINSFSQKSKKEQRDSATAAATRQMVEEQRYHFNAETAYPPKGRMIQLSPGYTLKVSKDTVECDLPYFGRAYSGGFGSTSDGGIKFTSVKFDYESKTGKKGGWIITIKPKDDVDAQQLLLNIYDNGTASLNIISQNRQPISYKGYIALLKSKEKK